MFDAMNQHAPAHPGGQAQGARRDHGDPIGRARERADDCGDRPGLRTHEGSELLRARDDRRGAELGEPRLIFAEASAALISRLSCRRRASAHLLAGPCENYSTLVPERRTTFSHFSVSVRALGRDRVAVRGPARVPDGKTCRHWPRTWLAGRPTSADHGCQPLQIDGCGGLPLDQIQQHSPPGGAQDTARRGSVYSLTSQRDYDACSRSILSATRKRAASPPVTTRWSKVRERGKTRRTAG
jgi:hypothetical protein